MQETDLEMVRQWRNSDRVRLNMINQHIIGIYEHVQWFKSIDWEHDRYLIFNYRNRPVGLVQYNDIDKNSCMCEWGFYLGKTDVPPGTGILMGYLGIEYAFKTLKVSNIYGIVLSNNKRSQRYHEKLGFREEDSFRVLSDGRCQNWILRYWLSNTEWETAKRNLKYIY